jgi:hypothetical protein
LVSKDAKSFRNRPVIAQYYGDDTILRLDDSTNSFSEMLRERKKPQDVSYFANALMDGYMLANVGVSGIFVVRYDKKDYLMTTKSDRMERKYPDTVAKLLSAFVPAELMHEPETHMMREVSEEFLPTIGDDMKILTGMRDGVSLEKAFDGILPYSNMNFYMGTGNQFQLPGMRNGRIILMNGNIGSVMPEYTEFHAAADTNSGQLVFKYNLWLPNHAGLSLHHSEDRLNMETGMLDIYLYRNGILLFQLDNDMKLTGDAYVLEKNRLMPYEHKDLLLSEAFAPKISGISSQNNIHLNDYLEIQ